ncbi:hypothetical protein HDU98_005219 [Podochytrium sp. JEL0797]|nr:hypothetical protein HDU98_005219 [Podochytrium sp. JEL0797]
MTDIALLATMTASSTDTTGVCAPNNCSPQNTVDRNQTTNDVTMWQSSLDSSCGNVWLKADWSASGPYSVSGFMIEYAMPHTAVLSALQLTSTAAGLLQSLEVYSCSMKFVNNQNTTGRVDTCLFDPTQNGGLVWDTVSAKFIFSFSGANPAGCQVAIDEIQVLGGTPGNVGSSIGTPASSSSPSGMSVGGFVGIIFAILFVAGLVGLWAMRQRNLRLRKLVTKMFEERRLMHLINERAGAPGAANDEEFEMINGTRV